MHASIEAGGWTCSVSKAGVNCTRDESSTLEKSLQSERSSPRIWIRPLDRGECVVLLFTHPTPYEVQFTWPSEPGTRYSENMPCLCYLRPQRSKAYAGSIISTPRRSPSENKGSSKVESDVSKGNYIAIHSYNGYSTMVSRVPPM